MTPNLGQSTLLAHEIKMLVRDLGRGRVYGVAYDTAWVARLAGRYSDYDFSLEWLRRNQYEDGTWGAPYVHYHDRFISTLAAIVALREVGTHPRDKRRVKRGEDALWKLVGHLGKDDSYTVGFPIRKGLKAGNFIYKNQTISHVSDFSDKLTSKPRALSGNGQINLSPFHDIRSLHFRIPL